MHMNDFHALLISLHNEENELHKRKRASYAPGDDVLRNFKDQGHSVKMSPMHVALCLAEKHRLALLELAMGNIEEPEETVRERIRDVRLYMGLFFGLWLDQHYGEVNPAWLEWEAKTGPASWEDFPTLAQDEAGQKFDFPVDELDPQAWAALREDLTPPDPDDGPDCEGCPFRSICSLYNEEPVDPIQGFLTGELTVEDLQNIEREQKQGLEFADGGPEHWETPTPEENPNEAILEALKEACEELGFDVSDFGLEEDPRIEDLRKRADKIGLVTEWLRKTTDQLIADTQALQEEKASAYEDLPDLTEEQVEEVLDQVQVRADEMASALRAKAPDRWTRPAEVGDTADSEFASEWGEEPTP